MPDAVAWVRFHIQYWNDDAEDEVRHVMGRGLKRQRVGVVDEDVTRKSVAGGGALVQNSR